MHMVSVIGTWCSKMLIVLYYITVTVKCNATPWGAGGIYVDTEFIVYMWVGHSNEFNSLCSTQISIDQYSFFYQPI